MSKRSSINFPSVAVPANCQHVFDALKDTIEEYNEDASLTSMSLSIRVYHCNVTPQDVLNALFNYQAVLALINSTYNQIVISDVGLIGEEYLSFTIKWADASRQCLREKQTNQ